MPQTLKIVLVYILITYCYVHCATCWGVNKSQVTCAVIELFLSCCHITQPSQPLPTSRPLCFLSEAPLPTTEPLRWLRTALCSDPRKSLIMLRDDNGRRIFIFQFGFFFFWKWENSLLPDFCFIHFRTKIHLPSSGRADNAGGTRSPLFPWIPCILKRLHGHSRTDILYFSYSSNCLVYLCFWKHLHRNQKKTTKKLVALDPIIF